MIDLDHFKAVNDRYGHQAGDRVLAGVAAILRENIRPTISRSPLTACSQWRKNSGQPVEETTKQDIGVTISIGASCGLIEKDVEKEMLGLIARADKCLYNAKKEGRNGVICISNETPGGTSEKVA